MLKKVVLQRKLGLEANGMVNSMYRMNSGSSETFYAFCSKDGQGIFAGIYCTKEQFEKGMGCRQMDGWHDFNYALDMESGEFYEREI